MVTASSSPSSIRVHVLMSGCSRLQGGMFHSVRHLWQEAARHGISPHIHGVDDGMAAEDSGAFAPLPVQIYPNWPPRNFAFSPAMYRALLPATVGGKDCISLHGLWDFPSLVANACRRRNDTPIMIHPHGMLEPWAVANGGWKKRAVGCLWHQRLLNGAMCFRALTRAEAGHIRRWPLNAPVALLPNGIRLDDAPPPARTVFDEHVPGLDGHPAALFLSRVHPKKGLPILLKAWARLGRDLPALRDWRLVVAGDDRLQHTAQMRSQALDLGLEQSVLFPGPLYGEAKRAAFAHAQIFVLPSHSEGFSVAILEAAGAGLPVLMTPGCNFPELEEAGGAIVSDPTDDSMRKALGQLVRMNDEERRAMGARGRALVAHNYNWPHLGRQWAEVVRWIAEGRPNGKRPECVEA